MSTDETDALRLTEAHVSRIATRLVECHGPEAELIARRWAVAAAVAGNAQRAAAWLCILETVSNGTRQAFDAAA